MQKLNKFDYKEILDYWVNRQDLSGKYNNLPYAQIIFNQIFSF
jgi:hypothetical protein